MIILIINMEKISKVEIMNKKINRLIRKSLYMSIVFIIEEFMERKYYISFHLFGLLI